MKTKRIKKKIRESYEHRTKKQERNGKVKVKRVIGIKKENRIEKGVLGRRDKRK